jgi:hypothetical protein
VPGRVATRLLPRRGENGENGDIQGSPPKTLYVPCTLSPCTLARVGHIDVPHTEVAPGDSGGRTECSNEPLERPRLRSCPIGTGLRLYRGGAITGQAGSLTDSFCSALL